MLMLEIADQQHDVRQAERCEDDPAPRLLRQALDDDREARRGRAPLAWYGVQGGRTGPSGCWRGGYPFVQ